MTIAPLLADLTEFAVLSSCNALGPFAPTYTARAAIRYAPSTTNASNQVASAARVAR